MSAKRPKNENDETQAVSSAVRSPVENDPTLQVEDQSLTDAGRTEEVDSTVPGIPEAPEPRSVTEVIDQTLDSPPEGLPAASSDNSATAINSQAGTAAVDATLDFPTERASATALPAKAPGSISRTEKLGPPGTLGVGSVVDCITLSKDATTAPLTVGPSVSVDSVSMPSETVSAVPFPVSGYEILGLLGRGGMGVVYKARQAGLNRLVALKMITGSGLSDPGNLARFDLEARAVAKLQHPNIVQVFEVGTRQGQPFIALEYLDGGCLKDRLDGTPMPPKLAARLMETLARAMHYAHERGIVHRDLKPANVLFASDGAPKIADFGLAKQLDDQELGQTSTNAILGTPTYMAPEQAEGKTRDVGPSADIYSLGAMFYDIITGRPPFKGSTVLDTLHMVRSVEPVPPRRMQPNLPLDLDTICLKCLEKDPRRRYANALELAEDLKAFEEGRAVSARPISALERARKWARRRPAVAALILVICLSIVGVIGILAYYGGEQRRLRLHADDQRNIAVEAKKKAEESENVAVKALGEAETERGKAVESEKKAVREKEEAEAQRKRAQANFVQAKRAVDELTRVAKKRLLNLPGAETVRADLVEKVAQFYEEFAARSETDPSLRLDTAQAYRRVGDARELLNKPTEAAAAYRKAATLFAAELGPAYASRDVRIDNTPLWKAMASIRLNQWKVLEGNSDAQKEAEESLNDAQAIYTKLAAVLPDDPAPKFELASSYNDLGIRHHRRPELEKAREQYQLALDTYAKLDADFAKRPDCQLEIARTEKNLAATYATQRSTVDQANKLFTGAVTRLKKLIDGAKNAAKTDDLDLIVTAARKELGEIYLDLGVLEGDAQFDKARGHFTDAIDLYGDLLKASADVPEYRYLLAAAYRGRADLLLQKEKLAEAKADLTTAFDRLTELKPHFAGNPMYRFDWARAGLSLGEVFNRLGDAEQAKSTWTSILDALDDPSGPEEARLLFGNAAGNLMSLYDKDVRAANAGRRWGDVDTALQAIIGVRKRRARVLPTPENRNELASTQLALAKLRLNQRFDYRGAATALADVPVDTPLKWGKYRSAAAVLGRCMIRADADLLLPEVGRSRLRKEYGDRCLALLRPAVDQEWRELPDLEGEDFVLLRGQPAFTALAADLKKKKQE
jgi:tetratricopeptide (TPR) repeat protein